MGKYKISVCDNQILIILNEKVIWSYDPDSYNIFTLIGKIAFHSDLSATRVFEKYEIRLFNSGIRIISKNILLNVYHYFDNKTRIRLQAVLDKDNNLLSNEAVGDNYMMVTFEEENEQFKITITMQEDHQRYNADFKKEYFENIASSIEELVKVYAKYIKLAFNITKTL